MALVTLKEVVDKAYKEGYAVPAFNYWSQSDAAAIVKGAESMRSPVILMASGSCIKSLGLELAAFTVQDLARRSKVPIVLHLDHAENLDLVYRAMKVGFTGVMYDGSKLPVEENIENTRAVVSVAAALGVSVEAEIGRVGRGEEGEEALQVLTDPADAVAFLKRTGVDALAVAVGTCHGMQKQEAGIRYDILDKLTAIVHAPLVLHGSSGVKDEDLVRVSKSAISKVNIGTKLKAVCVEGIRGALDADATIKDSAKLLAKGAERITEVVAQKIKFLGSSDRA
jgi:ketose-bisphosphate aldolase